VSLQFSNEYAGFFLPSTHEKSNMMRPIFGLFCSILWLFSNALLAQDSNVLRNAKIRRCCIPLPPINPKTIQLTAFISTFAPSFGRALPFYRKTKHESTRDQAAFSRFF
jgi:hypothetical protein